MPILEDALRALDRINWDFPQSGTAANSVHTTHWFPGNFIPQIPSALIQILSEPGDLVLDPFAGSGTTGLEAWRLARRAIVSDVLSSCMFILKGKVGIARGISPATVGAILERTTWDHECWSEREGLRGEGSAEELRAWFSPSTLGQLRYLWMLVEQTPAADRDAVALLFSDVLFACASSGRSRTSTGGIRRHHWGWIADNVPPKQLIDHAAAGAFRERVLNLRTLSRIETEGLTMAVCQDSRRLSLSSDSVDLVVTSPPYAGMIDYTHANRLLYLWMNWSMRAERNREIGARFKRFRKDALAEYLTDMRPCWLEISRVLRPGGYCAVVVGSSRKFPTAAEQTLESLGAELRPVWGPVLRIPSRRRVADRSASEATERIVVYQKPC